MRLQTFTPAFLCNPLPGRHTHPAVLPRRLTVSGLAPRAGSAFPVDIKEYGDGYRMVANVPGFGKDDISIGVENNVLTLSGKQAATAGEKDGGKFVRRERVVRDFARTFRLPEHVDASRVEARLDAGVLSLTLPKSAAAAKRTVEIR